MRRRRNARGWALIIWLLLLIAGARYVLTRPALAFITGTILMLAAIFWLLSLWGYARERGFLKKRYPAQSRETYPGVALTKERTRLARLIAARASARTTTILAFDPHFTLSITTSSGPDESTRAKNARLLEEKNERTRRWLAAKPKFPPDLATEGARAAFDYVENAPAEAGVHEWWVGEGKVIVAAQPFDIVIRNEDSERNITSRRVTVENMRAIWHHDHTASLINFAGFCHLRKSERQFYFRSIQAAADPINGQPVHDIGAFILKRIGRGDWTARVHPSRY